jgi:hypothetical protein
VPALGIWADDYVRAKQLGALGAAGCEQWMIEMEAAIGGGLAPAALEVWGRRRELGGWLAGMRPLLEERSRRNDALVGERLRAAGIAVRVPEALAPASASVGDAPQPVGRWHVFAGAVPAERPVPDPMLAELIELRAYARAIEVDRDALRSRFAHDRSDPGVAPTATRTTTVLDQMRLEVDPGRIALVGRLSAPHLDATEVRFRVYARGLAGRVDASATPLLPIAMLLAARLGTDLVVDAPVDELALGNADRIGALYHDWWGWRPPRISAATVMPPTPRSSGTGLWFSRGVDSTDTLVRSLAGELVEDGHTVDITHLLGLDWIDAPFAVSSTPEVWSDTEEAAAALGLPLLRFTTDVRRVLDPVIGWDHSYGAVFAGLGLLVAPVIGTVLLSASGLGPDPRPHGSHPALDPLWSTSRARIVHAGADRGRAEKVARIGADDWALARLKVCWEADSARNCGRCGKCLATMTALEIAGALERCDRFDGELSAHAVLRVARAQKPLSTHPSTIADLLRNLPGDAVELRAAWGEYQERLARQLEAGE